MSRMKRLAQETVLPLQLKQALADILSQQGAQTPQKVRFFRGQMQTIISRALTDLDIKPVPSRRCFALIGKCRGTRLEQLFPSHVCMSPSDRSLSLSSLREDASLLAILLQVC